MILVFYAAHADEDEEPAFERVCPKCGRYVKADSTTSVLGKEPNATCSRCGRVRMDMVGWSGDFERATQEGES